MIEYLTTDVANVIGSYATTSSTSAGSSTRVSARRWWPGARAASSSIGKSPIIGVLTLFEGTNFRSMRCFGPVHYDYLALRMVTIFGTKTESSPAAPCPAKDAYHDRGVSGIPTRFSNVGC